MCDATNCTNIGETEAIEVSDGITMNLCIDHLKVAKEGIEAFENRTPSWEIVPE